MKLLMISDRKLYGWSLNRCKAINSYCANLYHEDVNIK